MVPSSWSEPSDHFGPPFLTFRMPPGISSFKMSEIPEKNLVRGLEKRKVPQFLSSNLGTAAAISADNPSQGMRPLPYQEDQV